ncbi:nitroreductase/quinone reductase family protein [Streptomyces avicenniae]|uniref:nitroreductase/quinone reductase family protein n=1 Tax=Streptomyces avicenniae TaxID=500153 RepID=UPI00069CB660|nr:nitroreductase/quinone reductase family protein [Streptomyces avicenniae]
MPADFNQHVIDSFRANDGQVGPPFENARLLLLTTTGARSGAPHTTPVGYLPDDERVLVIASAGGADRHPAWYHNLRAHPLVTVEDGVFTYEARATVLDGEERDLMFARAVETDPGWAEYQERTARVIPVVALEAAGVPRPNHTRGGAMLRSVHDGYRRELALIRAELAASGPLVGAQLRANCLTVCSGLGNHHGGEDGAIFPFLAAGRPALTPVLDRLREEHVAIAALTLELRQLLADGGERRTADLLPAFDRLAGELIAHLDREEAELLPALDALIP